MWSLCFSTWHGLMEDSQSGGTLFFDFVCIPYPYINNLVCLALVTAILLLVQTSKIKVQFICVCVWKQGTGNFHETKPINACDGQHK